MITYMQHFFIQLKPPAPFSSLGLHYYLSQTDTGILKMENFEQLKI